MGNPAFFTEYLADAQTASAQCGFLVSVILAQWADETAYGGSSAFVSGNNFAGVSVGGGVNSFPSKTAGLDAYISTAKQSYLDNVRAANNSTAQCQALGKGSGNGAVGSGLFWAAGGYDQASYNKGIPRQDFNFGVDLISIIAANNLTQYDAGSTNSSSPTQSSASGAGSSSPALTSAQTAFQQFAQAFQPIPGPAPGLGSDVTTDSFTIDGTTVSLLVSGAVVTPQLDLSLTKASTITLTILDPDRTIINSLVFAQTSTLQFATPTGEFLFSLVSVEKADSVLTVTFEAWVVAALRTATGAFTVGPGTMTRTQFAQLLVGQINGGGADFAAAPDSFLSTLGERYIHTTKEQLSRGTSDLPLEDSWTCLQRLASEIQWVCYESFNTIYFGPYSYLTSKKPAFEPVEFTDGVQTINGTYDVGQPLGDITVTCVADSWTPLIGDCVKINNLGPFNGNWLVSQMERDDMLEPDITVTLTQPLPGLPEPGSGGATPAAGIGGTTQTAGGSSAALKALAYAKSQLGVPYVWGGETAGVGFDCSGLVQAAYASAGIKIPRVTQSQWPSGAGAPVPPGIANLQPGDLVFFAPALGQPAEHVAMVVSTNIATNTVTVIEAPHTGADVQYSTMSGTIGSAYGGTLVYLGAERPAQ